MSKQVVVSRILEPQIKDQEFELAECKGRGHPDVLCDGIAERISFDYVQWCLTHIGGVLHHNFDKILLVGGQSKIDFGNGEITHPIRIQVGGRATHLYKGKSIPVQKIVRNAVTNHLKETLRNVEPAKHCLITCLVREGASQLARLAEDQLANDTISCTAFWPRSPLENIVFSTTAYVNGELTQILPLGEDVKLSAFRVGKSVRIVVAVPLLARDISNMSTYLSIKTDAAARITRFASKIANHKVSVMLNAADTAQTGYMTVIGTSAEMGDDGSVGRGNRSNGFLAPARPSSTPPAGKNPISHPGKVYNVVASRMAQRVVESIAEIEESRVFLFTTIGTPLSRPTVTNIAVRPKKRSLTPSVESEIRRIAKESLDGITETMRELLHRYPVLY